MNIEHELNSKFYVQKEDQEAVLDYSMQNDCLNILRVYVPPVFRGQGIAAELATAAFEYALAKEYKVIPTCPYVVETFLKRYPKYQSIVANK